MTDPATTPSPPYSPDPARGWMPWGLLAPFLALIFVVAPIIATNRPLEAMKLIDADGDPVGPLGLTVFLLVFAGTALLVLVWVRLVERRPMATIGLARPGANPFLSGMLIGGAMIAAMVAASWGVGGYTAQGYAKAFASPQALGSIAVLLAAFAIQASTEEVLFRGWLLSAIARKSGIWAGVLLSSALFTLLHYGPGLHWLVIVNTVLFAFFACSWSLGTRSIWGAMGWHTGWNWLLAVGFELPVTGLDAGLPALLVKLVPNGTIWLTGGADGPEGSVFCTLLLLAGIALFVPRIRREAALRRHTT